ncbi:MAG: hypothetical protein KF819_17355 [Labilithrix sp.]|nr:hypothetical protein [Labilithrix sp.]
MGSRFIALSVLAVVACGGSTTPPPAGPQASVTDGGVETFGEVHASDLAEIQGLGDAGAAPAPAAPAEPSGAGAGAGANEKPDECTPLAVEWEKRARPQLKACYAEGKKKEPNLTGTVKITVDIDTLGKIRATKIIEKSLPDPVAQCMLKVLKAAPPAEAATKCPGKSLTIPMTFPTPH